MSKARDLANSADVFDTVSTTELGYLDGVSSAIQTQIDGKQAVVSGVDSTEIGYLDGVTSAIQTQIDSKVASSLVDAKGDLLVGSADNTVSRLAVGTDGYYLAADSAEASGVKWAAASAGGMTLLATTTLSGTTTTVSSINQGYKNLFAIFRAVHSSGGSFAIRTNGVTSANYYYNPTNIGNGLAFASYWNNGSAEFGFSQLIPTDNNNTGYLWIYDYANTAVSFKFTESKIYSDGGDDILTIQGVNRATGSSGIDSITYFSPSGATISGTVLLYGVS